MNTFSEAIKIKVVFFSGTRGTAMVAEAFQKALKANGKTVVMHELNSQNSASAFEEDMLLILYAVHACNAPEAIYEYIEDIPMVDKRPAVVISVSGGGEITPNTACRLHCIKRMEKKGFKVIYEKMIVMPSNWIIPTPDGLSMRLLEILPVKIEKVINELSNGINRRTKPSILDRVLSNIGELEKSGAKFCGKRIKVNESCNGCGWCGRNCPRGNITMLNSRPSFGNRCSICLKCIYGCPRKALMPGIGKFVVIKQGYDLKSIPKSIEGVELESIEKLARGYLFKGVKKYLLEDD